MEETCDVNMGTECEYAEPWVDVTAPCPVALRTWVQGTPNQFSQL